MMIHYFILIDMNEIKKKQGNFDGIQKIANFIAYEKLTAKLSLSGNEWKSH